MLSNYAGARLVTWCECVCIMTRLLLGMCRYNQLLKQKAQLEELEKVLKAEQEKMLSENQRHQATAAEYHKLKEENDK